MHDTEGFTIRKVSEDDVDILFKWRNTPELYKWSTSKKPVVWEEHKKWFASVLNGNSVLVYIALLDDSKCGQIRFNLEEKKAVISVYLAKEFLGFGIGKKLIKSGCEKCAEEWTGVKEFVAYIRSNNIAAAKSFEYAGFKNSSQISDLDEHFTFKKYFR